MFNPGIKSGQFTASKTDDLFKKGINVHPGNIFAATAIFTA